jgi:hypothetical protein
VKDLFLIFLIICLSLSTVACTTNTTSEGGVLFYREKYEEWGWHADGDETKDGKYEGQVKKGKPHGYGKFTYYKESKDSVWFLSLMIPGLATTLIYGVVVWSMVHQKVSRPLDTIYIGNWNRGNKHGKGTYFFPNGDRYEGKWKRGKQHGEGTYFFSEGDKYVGNWKDGKKHGKGTYFFADGDRFEGNWKDGEAHGKGAYVYPGGEIYSGEWKDGNKQEYGPLIFPK